MKRCFIWLFLFALILSGCSSRRTTTKSQRVERIGSSVAVSPGQTDRLVREARKWIGTPYRYGGSSKSGTDCSGLVMVLYADVYGLSLPRSSAQQQEYALPISERDLETGDLVFFATGGGSAVSHVGIYIGSGKMIHASLSRGVIESDLSEKYYRRTFHSAGRVVSPASSKAAKAERDEIRERIKRMEREKKQLEKEQKQLKDLDRQIEIQADSIYVTNPEIFD